MNSLKYLVAIAMAALLSACGGGADESTALIPERLAAAPRAQVSATVTSVQAAEELLNWAEAQPSLASVLTPHQPTRDFMGVFKYRVYPGNIYVGVIVTDVVGFQLNGVYVLAPQGLGFGTLENPAAGYVGTVNTFMPHLVINNGGSQTGHTLTVRLVVPMASIDRVVATIHNVPAPNSEQSFCNGLAADTVFHQIGTDSGGSLSIRDCRFDGTTGEIDARVSMPSPFPGFPGATIDYEIYYTYN